MNRLFGSKTQKQKPTLTDVATNVDERNETIEKKIARLDAEIRKLAQQAAKMREGPAKNAVKMKALRLLKQKKVYERQSEQLANQSFNISQTDFTIRSLQDTKTTISAMKAGSKAMKKEMKNINVDQIYDITDDLADMMDVANEVQDALGENYATPDVDEAELEDELANLGDDLGVDSGYLDQALDAPSVPSTSLPGENVPAATPGAKSTVDGVPVDEFGLPQIS
ncbi:unnamed protein product [Calicophoron daubneyi]|uniref:Charged multivesicular body protein 5 n=1 Tax=Calicophoron daubneyi TaxID=300641 RepID=A0AAV2TKR4_CALDB